MISDEGHEQWNELVRLLGETVTVHAVDVEAGEGAEALALAVRSTGATAVVAHGEAVDWLRHSDPRVLELRTVVITDDQLALPAGTVAVPPTSDPVHLADSLRDALGLAIGG